MTQQQAKQIDSSKYVELDEETNLYCIFGEESGFAYSCYSSYEEAKEALKA